MELRNGRPVKIIYWEAKGPAPIIGLFMADDGSETTTEAHSNGRWSDDESYVSDYDLFIVIPAGEMTPFEEKLIQFYDERISMESDNLPEDREGEILADHLHRKAAELLVLAREQFIKDGYVIEKKAFHDAVEKVDPEVMKEVSENVDKLSKEGLTEFEIAVKSWMGVAEDIVIDDSWVRNCAKELLSLALKRLQPEIDAEIEKAYKNADDVQYRKGFKDGKAEALKDLPRWKKSDVNDIGWSMYTLRGRKETFLYHNGHIIDCQDLEKLPGFKED